MKRNQFKIGIEREQFDVRASALHPVFELDVVLRHKGLYWSGEVERLIQPIGAMCNQSYMVQLFYKSLSVWTCFLTKVDPYDSHH